MADTNFGLTPPPAGVTPAQLAGQNNTIAPEKYRKTFFQTGLGLLLTGATGALIGMAQRHADKVKYAKQMEQQGMQNLMNLEMAPESQAAYQQSQMLANQGMDAASQQLAIQENARGMNMAFKALGGRRSVLAGLPGLAVSSSDFATRLAAQNAMMKQQNMSQAIQTGMQYGGQRTALQQAKNEALINKGVAERSRLNQTLTTALTGGAQIAGALLGKPPGA